MLQFSNNNQYLSHGKILKSIYVPVAQWIEYWPPEPVVRVRISPGTSQTA